MNMTNSDIKYCVTSYTDLLGISNHLEIGNDLRTKIGQEVIKRLDFLEDSIKMFLEERRKYSKYYPKNVNYRRINDSLILTLDLPDFLTPRIGELAKDGLSVADIEKFFPIENFKNYEEFEIAYKNKITQSILELTQFIGLSARIHSFINRRENENYFPGAKTIISSGYRRSYITSLNEEDYFSANFSFSNAYIAESLLKGQKFFIDNFILKLLGSNMFTRNILKISSFIFEPNSFDPFDDNPISIDTKNKPTKGEVKEVVIFRKKYLFREVNPSMMAFLHLFPILLPYLNGEKKLVKRKKKIFRSIYNHFLNVVTTREISENTKYFFYFRFDMEDDIHSVKQLVLTEKSTILEKQNKENLKKILLKQTSL